ncbi:phospholipase D-like domain-containing protein [Halorientalis marina]|uniref:phospholipase D-like domain-containing protein n=1 Tax=Halorientalis marina TaxID=2931976 RepID=UPI001FF1AAAD|nr:phospholipase D-like domain-containing protein [Halorientalis marina]
MTAVVRALVFALLASVAVSGLVGAAGPGFAGPGAPDRADNGTDAGPPVDITAVYPNPVADGDSGEFVVLRARERTALGTYTVADDDGRAALPNVTVEGHVALSPTPNRTRNRTDARVVRAELPRFANTGERVTLRRNGHVVATLTYADAPEGELARPADGGSGWHPLGATDRPVVTADGGTVRPFVLPDAPAVPLATVRDADDRLLLAGYTLTSERIVTTLANASRRGVAVSVLVDAAPVGGLTRREAAALDRLVAANVSVRVLGGDRARYDFHHAKYAIVDDRALVTTENWKPAGTGGHSSRGWGVVVGQQEVVAGLVETFRADAGWRGATDWRSFRRGRSFEPAAAAPANGTFPSRFEPRRVRAERVELLVAPDNAERRLVALLDEADDSIRIEQVSVGSRHQPFLRAALRAARRGVDVRILLSSAWYVEEENRRLVRWLNDRAAREDLPLEAELAEPNNRFEKVHAKGVVIDGEQVVIGSLNWNNNSARDNREVALVLHGEAVAGYYAAVFDADWEGGIRRLPAGLAAAVLLAALVTVAVARRIEFGGRKGVGPERR